MFDWISVKPENVEFFNKLSIVGFFLPVIFLYFTYHFPKEKKMSFWKTLLIFLPSILFIIFSSSSLNIDYVDTLTPECEPVVGYLYYFGLLVTIVYLIWSFIVILKKFRFSDINEKKQIKLVFFGFAFFIIWGIFTNVISQFLGLDYMSFFGPIGSIVLIFFLGYAITKYRLFNIKLIAAQALTYLIWILIGSQLFFIKTTINFILTGATLTLSVVFGIMLIKSIKGEIRRKEELQRITEQLAVANDELRKLDNAKSEFISIASHQLRTPLTSIKGYISLILEGTYGTINSVLIDPMNKIYASNERLIQLVEDLLNVSRIESGRMEYTFGKCDIRKTIKELYDTFSVIAKDKGLYLHLDIPENSIPEIEADCSKTREVISNLIDNGLKYTKRGGVTVKMEFIEASKNLQFGANQKERIKVIVSDTGMGVPETELPYLFSKFSRGKDTSRLHVSGTGLGLYVGKSMIEAQHGRIWVESEGSGKGSKFIVEMPVVQPK